ncbi:hypothetical protein K438DRAFT_2022759 [Mycena galopus ATCC 62051]|nr:hypothetical protein K438DRAFT_2022759 [Mycena galopus ATCC 62051]
MDLTDRTKIRRFSDLFASTCADLYARMLDTVPYGVELSDVITPLPVKPDNVVLTMDGDVLRLTFAGVGGYNLGRYSTAWYGFKSTNALRFLSLDAFAGVMSLRGHPAYQPVTSNAAYSL